MEVASPGLMNQRRYEQQSRFVPKVTIPEVKVAAEADIEDIAFDKAEQAESIEKLYAEQEKLRQALRDMGEDGESEDKERLEQRESALRERIEQIEGEIKAREKEKEQQRLDEGTVG
jgi:hypothetical protein